MLAELNDSAQYVVITGGGVLLLHSLLADVLAHGAKVSGRDYLLVDDPLASQLNAIGALFGLIFRAAGKYEAAVATETKRRGEGQQARQSGARRLVAGLRISRQDERLLEVVRPLLPEAASEGEVAYRLWRRGLELALAEAAGLGVPLPPSVSEEQIAVLAA